MCIRLHSNQFYIIAKQFKSLFQWELSQLFLFRNFNTNWKNNLNCLAIIQNWFECKRMHTIVYNCKAYQYYESLLKIRSLSGHNLWLTGGQHFLYAVLFITWRDFHFVKIFLKSWSKQSNHSLFSFNQITTKWDNN